MGLWVEYLLYKCEDLRLDPQNHEKPDVAGRL